MNALGFCFHAAGDDDRDGSDFWGTGRFADDKISSFRLSTAQRKRLEEEQRRQGMVRNATDTQVVWLSLMLFLILCILTARNKSNDQRNEAKGPSRELGKRVGGAKTGYIE